MESKARRLQTFVAKNGKSPFEEWLSKLRDRRAKAAVFTRLDRLRFGSFGDCKSVGGGVYELRIRYGPGYRVYFGLVGTEVVLLLGGGEKSTQPRDIEACLRMWKEFKNGKKGR